MVPPAAPHALVIAKQGDSLFSSHADTERAAAEIVLGASLSLHSLSAEMFSSAVEEIRTHACAIAITVARTPSPPTTVVSVLPLPHAPPASDRGAHALADVDLASLHPIH